ncbi:UNVERIFIED_CONTAM: hypothetical protein GTU68_058870, partial [Idotea baltica]|nr:hypothetical protein [Idotea baltica]
MLNARHTDTHYGADIKAFYYGNEYYLFVTEVFKDVRLVGAPPSSIGKYGKDTDNWVWPRHTGDFSLFRVYTGPNGLPAEYSPENIPLKPRHFLPISLDGVKEKDFTMVYGFPGQTQEYLTADGVDMIMNVQDPIRIELRAKRLEIIDAAMMQDDQVRIQYASKQSGISNGYKKWQGEIRGLKRDNAIEKKKEFEAEFTKRINANAEWKEAYGGILDEFEKYYKELEPLMVGVQYFSEAGYSIEVVNAAARLTRFIGNLSETSSDADKQAVIEKLERFGNNFFKNYSPSIDQKITATMLSSYNDDVPEALKPEIIKAISLEYNSNFEAYAKSLFEQSSLVDKDRYDAMVNDFSLEKVREDPAFHLMAGLYQSYYQVSPKYYQVRDEIDRLNRTYMKALREVFPEKQFYPDANSTLRVSFGKIEGMQPRDGVTYKPFTTLDGVINKYKPGD